MDGLDGDIVDSVGPALQVHLSEHVQCTALRILSFTLMFVRVVDAVFLGPTAHVALEDA